MVTSIYTFAFQISYLLSHLTVSDIIDMLAVAAVFFVVFQALYQTRALQILRGALIVAIFGAALLLLLPLDTFGWLIRLMLLAGAIALPILFQDELRRALTGIGRIGRWRGFGTDFFQFKQAIIKSVSRIASRHEGALIVLEGQTPLDEYVSTGVPLQAQAVTQELLLTIFYPNTPLHDGAIILRGSQVLAAGCILPLETEKTGDVRLGTRHRAALGLSRQVPDALVIVVSEETSQISIVHKGELFQGISLELLEGWLERFKDQLIGSPAGKWEWLKGGGVLPVLQNLGVALGLALVAWISVTFQTNPPTSVFLNNVPLTVIGPAENLVLQSTLPQEITVEIQTTEERAALLEPSAVRAEIHLDTLTAGVHQVPVDVQLADRLAQVLSVNPSAVNVILETLTSKTIRPTVVVSDLASLPPGYAVGDVSTNPPEITLVAPQSVIARVVEARLEVALGNKRADFQQAVIPLLLDRNGDVVQDVEMLEENVIVTIPIKRTFFTRQIAILADLELSTLDQDYELETVELQPASATLSGGSAALSEVGDFLITAPITLTGVTSELTIDVPVILPEDLKLLNENGDEITSTKVHIQVSPVKDYLVLEVPLEIRNLSEGLSVELGSETITVLVIGPRNLLRQIAQNQELVYAYVDLIDLISGAYTLPVHVQPIEGVEMLLFPSEVQVEILEGNAT